MTNTYTLQKRLFTLQMVFAGLASVFLLQLSSAMSSVPLDAASMYQPYPMPSAQVHRAAVSSSSRSSAASNPAMRREALRNIRLNQLRIRMQRMQQYQP
jgi:hypothetical protein